MIFGILIFLVSAIFLVYVKFFAGYGTCGKCKLPWSIVKNHTTSYEQGGNFGGGMFALCEGCWKKLKPEQKLPYYRAVWDEWKKYPECGKTDEQWEILKNNVLAGQ